MRFNKKAHILFLITTIFIVYTITVHNLAERQMLENSITKIVYWTGGASGSLFPWPKAPGMLEVLTQVNQVDLFIYRYLIKNWVLAGFSIVMWIITGFYVFRMIKSTKAEEKPYAEKTSISPFFSFVEQSNQSLQDRLQTTVAYANFLCSR